MEVEERRGEEHARQVRRRIGTVLVVVALAVVLMSSDRLWSLFEGAMVAVEPVMTEHRLAGMAAFAALAAVSAFLAFFSSTVLVPAAIHAWGATATVGLLWAGWVMGGAVAYAIGRWVGRPAARYVAGAERLAHFEERVTPRASFSLVVLLHLALQSEIPGIVLGLLRYRFSRFLMALALAEIPYAVGTIYLGRFFVDRRTLPLLGGALLAVLAATWAFRTLHRALDSGRDVEAKSVGTSGGGRGGTTA